MPTLPASSRARSSAGFVRAALGQDLGAVIGADALREAVDDLVQLEAVVAVRQQELNAHAPASQASRSRSTSSSGFGADRLAQLGLQRVGRLPCRLDAGDVLRMPFRHVVDSLVDGHELLCHVAIGDGNQHRRPPSREASVIQQAGHRVGCDRSRQLGEAHLR